MLKIPQNGYLEIACSDDAEYTAVVMGGVLFQQGTITGGSNIQLKSTASTLDIDAIVIYNASGGNSTVTVSVAQHTSVPMLVITLAADETLFYSSVTGWFALDASGSRKIPPSVGGDHGDLSGLTDDDHTQYLLIDGTRAMTGDLDVGTNIAHGLTGAEFDQQASNPSDTTANTLYINSTTGHLTRNELDLENAANHHTARMSGSTFFSVQHMQDIFHSAGWSSGGILADAGGGNVDVSAGTGFVRATNSALAQLLFFDWPAVSGFSVTSDTTSYFGVEYNAGTPQVVMRANDIWNLQTEFPIGNVVNEGGTLHFEIAPHDVGDHAGLMIQRAFETSPFARDSRSGGLILGETGTRNITISSGALWDRLQRFSIAALDTSVSGSFDAYYRDSPSGFVKVAAQTQWPNTQYDDGSGTLATMISNRWAVLWFYLELDGGVTMQYGRAQYTAEALAEAETLPSTAPERILSQSAIIGRIIFQKLATTGKVESVYTTTFQGSGVSNHDDLSNVGTNSHNTIDTHLANTSNPHVVDYSDVSGADSATDVTGTELETLTDGSNADALHVHASTGITQLTGDVTAGPGSGSQAATIAADSVTNSKLDNMAANTVKANSTTGSANPTDISISTNQVLGRQAGNITAFQVDTPQLANGAATLAKISGAGADDVLLGSGNLGSGSSYAEIALGVNLFMDGTTLNASSDIASPGGSTNNALMKWNGTSGNSAENSGAILDGSNNLSGIANLTNNAETIHTPASHVVDGSDAWDVSGATVIEWTEFEAEDEDVVMNGIVAGTAGRIIYIYNASSSLTLVLSHESESADAANRINFISGLGLSLTPGQVSAPILYIAGRWRSTQ